MHSTRVPLLTLKWILGCATAWVAVAAGVLLLPAAPALAAGTFFMTGTYEMNNEFALRRRIQAFQSPIVTTDPSGMGAIVIEPGVFSSVGDPAGGAVVADIACDPEDGIVCILQNAIAGFQPFPGFPDFAQAASTFTERNLGSLRGEPTGTLAPGGGPGTFSWCPIVGNPNNGTAFPWNCPGLGFGSPAGVRGVVQYSDGNRFGGTMAIARQSTVEISQRRNVAPSRFQHDTAFYDDVPWIIGVPISFTNAITPMAGPLTQSPVLGPFSSIQTLGPVVAPTGSPVLRSASTGFPWTTGMVRSAEDTCVRDGTCGANPFVQFTVTGSDTRGPDGQGKVSLVSGGMLQNREAAGRAAWGRLDLVLTVPEPTLLVGLGAGALLLMGLLHRRG